MNKGKKKNLSIPLFTDCRSYPYGNATFSLHSKDRTSEIKSFLSKIIFFYQSTNIDFFKFQFNKTLYFFISNVHGNKKA